MEPWVTCHNKSIPRRVTDQIRRTIGPPPLASTWEPFDSARERCDGDLTAVSILTVGARGDTNDDAGSGIFAGYPDVTPLGA